MTIKNKIKENIKTKDDWMLKKRLGMYLVNCLIEIVGLELSISQLMIVSIIAKDLMSELKIVMRKS